MKRILGRLLYVTSMITLPAFAGVMLGSFFFHKDEQDVTPLGFFERAEADIPNSGCAIDGGGGGGDGTCGAAGDGTCGG